MIGSFALRQYSLPPGADKMYDRVLVSVLSGLGMWLLPLLLHPRTRTWYVRRRALLVAAVRVCQQVRERKK
jgi:hypothetical protein